MIVDCIRWQLDQPVTVNCCIMLKKLVLIVLVFCWYSFIVGYCFIQRSVIVRQADVSREKNTSGSE